MISVGVPREFDEGRMTERRVVLTPAGVRELTALGATVLVESGAGRMAGFSDDEYRQAGAHVVYDRAEVYQRSDLVVRVARPQPGEYDLFREGQALLAFLHLAVAPTDFLEALAARRVTAIGYEVIQTPEGDLPVLKPMSRIAGLMAYQIAARLLEAGVPGGRGILIPGLPGIPPAEVVIIGAGNLGSTAALLFHRVGANVYVMDKDFQKLERLYQLSHGGVVTVLISQHYLEKMIPFADILITAVLEPGARAPVIVTEAMVRRMKPGAVILDFSIDQGGAVETSRLTPGFEHVYQVHGVIHFCVPNVPAYVPRTASYALTTALLPYLRELVQRPLEEALRASFDLRRGVYVYQGVFVGPVEPPPNVPTDRLERLLELGG